MTALGEKPVAETRARERAQGQGEERALGGGGYHRHVRNGEAWPGSAEEKGGAWVPLTGAAARAAFGQFGKQVGPRVHYRKDFKCIV